MPQTNYWDNAIGKMKESHLEFNIAKYKLREHLNLIKRWTSDLKDKRILKTDLFEEYFKIDSFFFNIDPQNKYGIDISKKIISSVGKDSDELKILNSDVCDLPFKNEKFDIIISNSTLDHIRKRKISSVIDELIRVLKPQGRLILTIDNRHNPLYVAGLFLGQKFDFLPFYQDRCYSMREIEKLFGRDNLEIVDRDVIFHVIPPLSHFLSFLEKYNFSFSKIFSKKVVEFSKKLESKKTKYLTGRLLCFNIEKVY